MPHPTLRPITALFCEGQFVSAASWPSEGEARAYARGCRDAAAEYGAGACAVYVLPGEGKAMAREESDSEAGAALAAVRRVEESER